MLFPTVLSDGEQDPFNKALKAAIVQHRKFWQDDEYDSHDWIALPLLAAAVLAHDHAGYKISDPSDYVPSWIIDQ